MIESKEWNWSIVQGDRKKTWLNPSIVSYYLVNRWKEQNKKNFLDLGCGLGRHTILFAKNGFNVKAFDLSKEAVESTKKYAKEENLKIESTIGDMLNLPYSDNSIECILCMNVISHTDTEGMVKIVNELKRVLVDGGECYLTLGSKKTWGFKQENWPMVDENTRIRMDEGPEKGIPHFYADYDLILKLFEDFSIEKIYHVEDFYKNGESTLSSYHYHVLIKK